MTQNLGEAAAAATVQEKDDHISAARGSGRAALEGDRPLRPQAGQHSPRQRLQACTFLVKQKIADFGLATRWSPASQNAKAGIFGTPYYQAPEQLKRSPGWFSPKIDCWALGVVFYEILEGRHPFQLPSESLTKEEFEWRVMNKDMDFKKTSNPKYVMLISRLLEKVVLSSSESKRATQCSRGSRPVSSVTDHQKACAFLEKQTPDV